jgi:hypothetical protein
MSEDVAGEEGRNGFSSSSRCSTVSCLLCRKSVSCMGVRPVVAIAGDVEGVERQNVLQF